MHIIFLLFLILTLTLTLNFDLDLIENYSVGNIIHEVHAPTHTNT